MRRFFQNKHFFAMVFGQQRGRTAAPDTGTDNDDIIFLCHTKPPFAVMFEISASSVLFLGVDKRIVDQKGAI
jgi:hypothetical protein